jgi:hypothetical protein
MEAMRSCLLNGFVVVFVSASVATARTAKSTRDPGIATRRDVAGREGVPRVENAEDAALRPRHPTPLRTTRRVVIIAAIAIGEDSSNARRVASSSVVTRVARERSRQNQPSALTRFSSRTGGFGRPRRRSSTGFAANGVWWTKTCHSGKKRVRFDASVYSKRD